MRGKAVVVAAYMQSVRVNNNRPLSKRFTVNTPLKLEFDRTSNFVMRRDVPRRSHAMRKKRFLEKAAL
jgi:hypothetical protein